MSPFWVAEINRITKERKALEQTRKRNKYIKTAMEIAKNETYQKQNKKKDAKESQNVTSL